jgi:hypothetical protein
MVPTDHLAAVAPRRPLTLRVTIAYDGERLSVQSVQRVAMITPPAVTPPPREGAAGFWFEVRDANGQLLFHRVLHDPMPQDLESFSEDGQTITRHPRPRERGTFEVLVPDVPGAQSFALWGAVTPPGLAPARSRPLVTTSFDDLRRAPPPQAAKP